MNGKLQKGSRGCRRKEEAEEGHIGFQEIPASTTKAMESEAEELQLLDGFGIVKEAFNFLLSFSRRKLVWALTFTLILPLSFLTLRLNFISGRLFIKFSERETYYMMEANTLSRERTLRELTSEWSEFLVFVTVYGAFVFALRMLSTAAVACTVASNYRANTNKLQLSYARIMKVYIPRLWKRLAVTFYSIFIMSFMAVLLAIMFLLIIFFSVVVRVEGDHKCNWGTFLFGVILGIVFVCLELYVSTAWSLASVVTVLEDECYGIDAMQKSSDLMRGKQTTVALLVFLYFILTQVIVRVFCYAVVEGRGHGVGTATRAVYGVLLVGLLCLVNLMGLLTQSVFYFVSKSYHHESIYDNFSLEV